MRRYIYAYVAPIIVIFLILETDGLRIWSAWHFQFQGMLIMPVMCLPAMILLLSGRNRRVRSSEYSHSTPES